MLTSILKKIKYRISLFLHGTPPTVTAKISYLSPNQRLHGKKIVITGGGRGLGLAMAKKMRAEGAEVLISGRNESSLQAASQELSCEYLVLDLQKTETFEKFILSCEQKLPGFNVLINNGGISLHEGDFRLVTPTQFDAQIATNLRGSYFLSQAFVQHVEHYHREATLLLISSETGETVDYLPYGLTKASINSLTKGLAKYLINSKIRVNAIAPGVTASAMTGYSAEGNLYCPYNITHRVYLPEEVAEIATFLISDASSCLNGQILVTNEGKTINLR